MIHKNENIKGKKKKYVCYHIPIVPIYNTYIYTNIYNNVNIIKYYLYIYTSIHVFHSFVVPKRNINTPLLINNIIYNLPLHHIL